MTYLTVDDILSINYLVNARTGRRHGNAVNVINSNSLHYVVSAVSGKVFGQDLYKTIYDKAAAYAFNIISRHIFDDGNKRTGLIAAFTFLESNGHIPSTELSIDEIVNIGFSVADGTINLIQLSGWFSRWFSI